MLLSEQSLEKAINTFFHEIKLPRPRGWSLLFDKMILKKAVPAFIEALKEIEKIDYCYGFDESKVFEDTYYLVKGE